MLPLDERCLVLLVAMALDWLIGDPPWLWSRVPHPVVLIGKLIERLETRLNQEKDPQRTRRLKGLGTIGLVIAVSGAIGLVLSTIANVLPFGIVLEIMLVTVLLAARSLDRHVEKVAKALETQGTDAAREAVSHIVGRDTRSLDDPAISRAAIESSAENFADGVIAPILWYLVAGLPGLLIYKTINTADSMIGYRNERYGDFGFWSAKIDDAANWIPARWSGLLIVLIASIVSHDSRHGLNTMRRDASRHVSPNAGWPEAAMAGALHIALGGPRTYEGKEGDGVWLNEEGEKDIGAKEIRSAMSITRAALTLQAGAIAVLGKYLL